MVQLVFQQEYSCIFLMYDKLLLGWFVDGERSDESIFYKHAYRKSLIVSFGRFQLNFIKTLIKKNM